jgi:HlyD family secretion protein
MSQGTTLAVAEGSPLSGPRNSFDQLDRLVRVTTVHGWVYLATLFSVCGAAVAFAVLYRVPTKVNGEGILLIDRDALARVRARATGRLISLRVKLGDVVAPGETIGEISQNELHDAIHEAELKLKDAEQQDLEFTRHEEQERETQKESIDRVRRAIRELQATTRVKLTLAESIAIGDDRLRARKYLGNVELLESREKLFQIKDDLNKGTSRLAELDLDWTKGENARRHAALERTVKVQQLKTRLELDRAKLVRTSQIVSQVHGHVVQIMGAIGELVPEGSAVVLLDCPKTEQASDGDASNYESIVFVPAGEGKKIDLGDRVEVTPATIKREEHGFIWGRVVGVWEMPATKQAMEAALEHPDLADAFVKRYAPSGLLRVHVKLKEGRALASDASSKTSVYRAAGADSKEGNRFRWSSPSGAEQPLKTGTMCQAAIVVDERRLIQLILPWLKKVAGSD